MALLFMDSFDHYATADLTKKWNIQATNGGANTISATGGRHGSGCYRFAYPGGITSGISQWIVKSLAPTGATAIIGFAVKYPSNYVNGGMSLVAIRDGNSTQVYVRVNPDGSLQVFRGNSTLLGSFTIPLAFDAYTYIELKVVIENGTAGSLSGRINGSPALDVINIDTSNTGFLQWSGFYLGSADYNSNLTSYGARNVDIDDLYVLDGSGPAPWNNFLGDIRVDAMLPTAPGASVGWSPSAGANWECVDDPTPNDDTDYVETQVAGALDTFTVGDAPAGSIILGVQQCVMIRKTDAGSGSAAPVIRHGTTNYQGPVANPTTAYGYALQTAQINPGTGAQWTLADFNAAEFGYKRI